MLPTETLGDALGGRLINLEPGEVLLREGDTERPVYLVIAGTLDVLRSGADDTSFVIGQLGPESVCGEVSCLTGSPCGATVVASTKTSVVELDASKLRGEPETPREQLLLSVARSLSKTLTRSGSSTIEALERELELMKMRDALASFLVHILLGFAAYALIMKALADAQVALENATVVTGPLLIGMAAITISWARRSRLPPALLGLTRARWVAHAIEGALWSLPVVAWLTVGKYAALRFVPSLSAEPLFPAFADGVDWAGGATYAVYAALVPLQEFVSRGAIQGPLFELLSGSQRRRMVLSILVSNTLFAVTHLHLTITYGVAAFIGGLLWGAIYARQRSLVGACVSHIIVGVYALWVLGLADVFKGMAG